MYVCMSLVRHDSLVAQWLEHPTDVRKYPTGVRKHPTGVRKVIGSNPVGTQIVSLSHIRDVMNNYQKKSWSPNGGSMQLLQGLL